MELSMGFVVGTAGHIDHGKTSLVHALTGIDCDRLEEEKRRGITIELGFAFCPLPNGEKLGIVDVPGHERFVKNMVAGAFGIDFVMLVIAADESIMPQTREHLEICSLLGIKHGLIALTKIDAVDEEFLELAKEDVKEFVKGSFLENAPIFPVSSHTKQGIDALKDYIFEQEHRFQTIEKTSLLRLPIDRLFTVKGHGTVVAGTLLSGKININDSVEILPSKKISKVRSLQSHGAGADLALPGKRTAVNLQGLDIQAINRGDVLASPDTLIPSKRWLVRLQCLSSSPKALKHRTEVHLHHGTKELAARLYFFDREALEPGQTALCDVRLCDSMVGIYEDPCIVRTFSPLRTVAGGLILYPLADNLPRGRLNKDQQEQVMSLPDQADDEKICTHLLFAGRNGLSVTQLAICTNFSSKGLEKLLQKLLSQGRVFCFDKKDQLYIAAKILEALEEECLLHAQKAHEKEPLRAFLPRASLLGPLAQSLVPKLGHLVLERLIQKKELVIEGEGLRLQKHSISLGDGESELKESLLALYLEKGATPPTLKELEEHSQTEQKKLLPILALLVKEGEITKIKDGLYYPNKVLKELEERLQAWFVTNEMLETSDFKEMTQLSRKFLIPLLEFFDKERLTLRIGDSRKWRGRGLGFEEGFF